METLSYKDSKDRAILLRKQGLTYSEILSQVPVAKSTISLWLHSVGLAQYQKQRITEKSRLAQKRGAERKKEIRIELSEKIRNEALIESKKLFCSPLWIAGTILYWAEGCKEKPWRPSEKVALINMDPHAIKLFCCWILKFGNITDSALVYEIYIHERANIQGAIVYWAKELNINSSLIRVYLKKHNPKPFRKNIGNLYHGIMRVKVARSTQLLRRIAGWTEGMLTYLN